MVAVGWRAYLPYRTQRHLRVDVWQLGLAYRILQLIILIVVGVEIFLTHGWAHSEVPAGRVNAYGETTDAFEAIAEGAAPSYCASAAHDYVFSDSFSYIQPACHDVAIEEVVTKSIGAVTFTTSIIETIEIAWNCASDDAASKEARCAAMNAPVTNTSAGAQCKCVGRETYYVKGVEALGVAFEHGYTTTSKISGGLDGSSALTEAEAEEAGGRALDTTVKYADGSEKVFPGGEPIILRLAELISLNAEGFGLDSQNEAVAADARGTSNKAYFRTTGMKLTVSIKYSNLRSGGDAALDNPDVDAELEVSAANGWAGPGPQVFYPLAPTADGGAQAYEKMIRYRQGVEVVFRPAGMVYAFDYQHFLNVLVSAYLFLAVAVTVMDFVTFNLLPNGLSKVLYAKRAERVSKVHSFAQLGLKAAVAVKDFKALDVDQQGFVEVKDLVSVFGSIPSVDKEQALLMAQTIMRAANIDTALAGRLTFNEFMSLFDGTTALDFDRFVDLVHTTGKLEKLDEEAKAAASQAYDAVEAGVDLAAERQAEEDRRNAALAAPAAPAAPVAGRISCFLCHKPFGVPPGAKLARCPHCLAVNPTDPRPEPEPTNPIFGGGGGLWGLFSRQQYPQQTQVYPQQPQVSAYPRPQQPQQPQVSAYPRPQEPQQPQVSAYPAYPTAACATAGQDQIL